MGSGKISLVPTIGCLESESRSPLESFRPPLGKPDGSFLLLGHAPHNLSKSESPACTLGEAADNAAIFRNARLLRSCEGLYQGLSIETRTGFNE